MRVVLLTTVALFVGCVESHPVLAPTTGASLAMAASDGVSIAASATEWAGDPEIYEIVLPFAVELRNQSDLDVRVKYEDFAIQGANGFSTTALNPFTMQLGQNDDAQSPIKPAAYHYTPQRSSGGGGRVGNGGGRSSGGRAYVGSGRGGARGYNGRSYYGGYYGFGAPWGFGWGGYGFGYGYGGWGYPGGWWGGYYAVAPPTSGPPATRFALPEGVIKRNGQTRGYLFFNKPAQSIGAVELQWTVKSDVAHALTPLTVNFEYVVSD